MTDGGVKHLYRPDLSRSHNPCLVLESGILAPFLSKLSATVAILASLEKSNMAEDYQNARRMVRHCVEGDTTGREAYASPIRNSITDEMAVW